MKHQPTRFAGILGLLGLTVIAVAGCGFNAEQQLANAFTAAGQTVFDQWLTDLANDTADALDDQPADNGNDSPPAGNTNDNEPANDNGGEDDPVARGATLVDNNCSICHGVDGASGFAPNIQGVDEALITAHPGTGGEGHTLIELSEQDIADIAAYLSSF